MGLLNRMRDLIYVIGAVIIMVHMCVLFAAIKVTVIIPLIVYILTGKGLKTQDEFIIGLMDRPYYVINRRLNKFMDG